MTNEESNEITYGLSLDGGGPRGNIEKKILYHMEFNMGEYLHHIFDHYSGVSIGSVLTNLIAVMKVNMINVDYLLSPQDMSGIFKPNRKFFSLPFNNTFYKGEQKTQIMKKLFGNTYMCETDKSTIVPVYDITNSTSFMFSSNHCYSSQLYQIIDGSTAAPMFFPHVQLNDGRIICDIGGSVNDPSMCLWIEMNKTVPQAVRKKILSIGTGLCKMKNCCVNTSPIQLTYSGDLLSILTDTSIVDHQMRIVMGQDYLRINDDLYFGASDKLDDVNPYNIEALEKNGDYWWDKHKCEILRFFS